MGKIQRALLLLISTGIAIIGSQGPCPASAWLGVSTIPELTAPLLGRERPFCTLERLCSPDSLAIRFGDPAESQSWTRARKGDEIEALVIMNVRSRRVQGWTYGIAHDPSMLEILEASTEGLELPETLFQYTQLAFSSSGPAPGFVSGIVLDIMQGLSLPIGENFPVARMKYRVIGDLDPKVPTTIRFSDELLATSDSTTTYKVLFTNFAQSRRPEYVIDGEIFGGPPVDCNSNGTDDAGDLVHGPSQDCNRNGILDECDIEARTVTDCNRNGIPDECDLAALSFGFKEPLILETGGRIGGFTIGSFDFGDIEDLAVIHPATEELFLFFRNPDQTFSNESIKIPLGVSPTLIIHADFDGNGFFDPLIGSAQGELILVQNFSFDGFHVTPVGELGFEPTAIIGADFDRDRDIDLAVAGSTDSQNFLILLNVGIAKFSRGPTDRIGTDPRVLTAADIDNDFDLDIISANSGSGNVSLLRNRGDGTFDQAVNFPAIEAFNGPGEPTSLAAADLDGDRALDLATSNPLSGKIAVLMNNGRGEFSSPMSLPALNESFSVLAGDLDRDGDQDIALIGERTLKVLLNDGRAAFIESASMEFPGTGFAAVRELNADFRPDLVLGNPELGRVAFLINEPRPFSADCNSNNLPDECDLASGSSADRNGNLVPDDCESFPFHRGDPNGDGVMDISDGLCMLDFLFVDNSPLPCLEAADANNDGAIDCTDPIVILGFLFIGTEPPADPGPPFQPCGLDSDPKGSSGDLGCRSYPPCS